MWDNTRQSRDRIESGEVVGPRIRSTGEILYPKGAVPPDLVFDVTGTMRVKLPEIADADEALAASKTLLSYSVRGESTFEARYASR